MKPIPSLFCGLVLLSTTPILAATAPVAPADKPATKSAAAPAKTPPAPAPAPVSTPAPTPAAPTMDLDAYIAVLTPAVNLSDAEKTQVHDLYADDAAALQKILNDAALSPLQKAQQVSDLRDARNQKIEGMLHNLDRQHAFYEVEKVYRVSLTEAAAEGHLAPMPAKPEETPVPGAAATSEVAPAKSDTGAAMSTGASPSAPAKMTPPPATNAPVAEPPPM